MCMKCSKGLTLALIGLLVLVNVYVLSWSWATFIGVLLVLLGVSEIFCPGHKAMPAPQMPAPKAAAKRKK